jgi:hypothetical protein
MSHMKELRKLLDQARLGQLTGRHQRLLSGYDISRAKRRHDSTLKYIKTIVVQIIPDKTNSNKMFHHKRYSRLNILIL